MVEDELISLDTTANTTSSKSLKTTYNKKRILNQSWELIDDQNSNPIRVSGNENIGLL